MNIDTIWSHVDTERDSLADLLDGLTDEQWSHPSLCSAWSVRDVAAHVAWQDVRLHQALRHLLRARFDSDVMIRDAALSSPLSHTEIVARIRSFHGRRVKPPFVSPMEPLTDALVHTQDICVPLGLEHDPPVEALVAALDRTVELNEGRLALRPPLRGVRLRATDGDWAYGAGHLVEGPSKWLLLTLAGRDVAHAHLSGEVAALGG